MELAEGDTVGRLDSATGKSGDAGWRPAAARRRLAANSEEVF
jgi:hypothetical protein